MFSQERSLRRRGPTSPDRRANKNSDIVRLVVRGSFYSPSHGDEDYVSERSTNCWPPETACWRISARSSFLAMILREEPGLSRESSRSSVTVNRSRLGPIPGLSARGRTPANAPRGSSHYLNLYQRLFAGLGRRSARRFGGNVASALPGVVSPRNRTGLAALPTFRCLRSGADGVGLGGDDRAVSSATAE